MHPQTSPAPDTLATPPPAPAEPPKPAMPAVVSASAPVAVAPAPDSDPTPQPMAVAPEPKSEGLPLPTVEIEQTAHSDRPEHTPEPLTEADAQLKPKSLKPSTPPPVRAAGPHAPVGIIVATILGMIILCGLAVALYMTSNMSSI
jgi:hypothetical protein